MTAPCPAENRECAVAHPPRSLTGSTEGTARLTCSAPEALASMGGGALGWQKREMNTQGEGTEAAICSAERGCT